MNKRVIDLHDEALLLRPQDASHEADGCPICIEWAMTPEGVPASFEQMDTEARQAPFGDVEYADDGAREGIKRFPIDTEAHVLRSHAYITSPDVAKNYSSAQLEQVSSRIKQAMSALPSADKAEGETINHRTPEGVMDTITKETHEALLQKAVDDATAQLREEKASIEAQLATTTTERDQAVKHADEVETEVSRLEGELDTAQVKLKSAEDENASLKGDLSARDEALALKEKAGERAEEVRALGLFPEEHIVEKAERWAGYSDDEFAEVVADWKAARSTSKEEGSVETASRMSGSSEGAGSTSTKTTETSARRRVLGI